MSDVLETEDTPETGKKTKKGDDLQTDLWDKGSDTVRFEEKNETVGDVLRKARLEKRLDLRDIAADLCIRPRFLENLENGKTKDLPGDAYAQGFVRSYASYLGLDAVGLAARYKLETADNLNETLKVVSPDPEEAEKSAPAPKLVFVSLALLLIGYVVWQGFFSGEEEVLPVADTVTILDDTYPLPEAVSSSAPAPDSVVSPADQTEQPAVVPPVPPKKPEAPVADDSSPKIYGRQTPDSRLYLEATEETWIEIKRGDTVMISRNLQKGDRYFVARNAEHMVLTTGNAGGLTFYLDGRQTPPIGPRGAKRSNISLDPDRFPEVEKKSAAVAEDAFAEGDDEE